MRLVLPQSAIQNRYGSYGWKFPSFDTLTTQMKTVYQEGKKRNNDQQKLKKAVNESADRGIEGATHHDFLNRLRNEAETRMNGIE